MGSEPEGNPVLTQPPRAPVDTGQMIADSVMLELWIVALAALVNAAPPRVHRDVCAALEEWRWRHRPRA